MWLMDDPQHLFVERADTRKASMYFRPQFALS